MVKKSKFERAKEVGWISYISKIPGGIEADAVLREVHDTWNRAGEDPQYEFVMEVRPKNSGPFEARFRRIIPSGLVPNFQLGRTFRVLYDPKDPSQVSFLYFTGEDGQKVDFRLFPLRLKHLEDTEMEPGALR